MSVNLPAGEVRFGIYPAAGPRTRAALIGYVRRVPAGRWVVGEAVELLPECQDILAACKSMRKVAPGVEVPLGEVRICLEGRG